MAVVSMIPNYQLRNSTGVNGMHALSSNRSTSFRSSSSEGESSRGSMPEIREEEEEGGEEALTSSPRTPSFNSWHEVEDKMFVAVGKEFKESTSTLVWVLRNNPGLKKIVLVHVHRPSPLIPMSKICCPLFLYVDSDYYHLIWAVGAQLNPKRLESKLVDAYRQHEKEHMDKTLDEYVSFCGNSKIIVDKLCSEMDDVVKGLLKLIAENGITKLVMGAAADRNFSKKMKAPRSRIACGVQKEAPASCKIWFTCKGNLICVREASSDGPASPVESPSIQANGRSMSLTLANYGGSPELKDKRSQSCNERLQMEYVNHSPKNDDYELSSTTTNTEAVDWNSGRTLRAQSFDGHRASTAQELQETLNRNDDLSHQVEQAIGESGGSKYEGLAKTYKNRQVERDLHDDNRITPRKENVDKIEREEIEMEKIQSQMRTILEEFQTVRRQKSQLECQITKSDQAVKDLEEKLSYARGLLESLQAQKDELQRERDDATKEANQLQRKKEEASSSKSKLSNFLEFSELDLQQATRNFDRSLIIGGGGYGCVYKGYIHHTPVAIKILHPESLQGRTEFHQEVEILSRVRHPNLVTLVGACSEDCALIYEYLPNGSLEDHLSQKEGTPPLSWQIRTRICYEVCCALIFLHSAKPSHVVHGDLKPSNILLDANFVSKLGDFGISRLLIESTKTTTLCHLTDPKGTLGYIDPEFQSTGELTPRSDVYSFGIILLRLLTGRPALGISNKVQEAVNMGRLQDIIDPTAGEWPLDQAEQLACLGIRCCEMNRKNRPDLANEVWRLQIKKNMSSLLSSRSLEKNVVPSYFRCPLYEEIMKDPCLAADGHTYEGEAMRKWLEGGNKVSPVTKLRLAHEQLLPNHALRAAIQDWQQQRRQQ